MSAEEIKVFFHKSIDAITNKLRMPKDYLKDLDKVDDWTFTIKVHYVLEGLLSFIISEIIGRKNLLKSFKKINLQSKLEILRELKIYDNNNFYLGIEYIQQLRNKLLHDFEQVNFNFKAHLNQKNAKSKFVKIFSDWWDWETITLTDINGKKIKMTKENFSASNPRFSILIFINHIFAFSHFYTENQRLKFLSNIEQLFHIMRNFKFQNENN